MKELYLISGLGADKRVFEFLDLHEYKTTHVEWIAPLKSEPVESYAKRLASQIKGDDPILVGVSFGGVMAIEIGKLIPTKKIILISSVESKDEIPLQSRWIGWFKLNKLVPASLFTKVNDGLFWFFGVEKESEKKLLTSIIEDTNPVFLKWGIDKILNWNNETKLGNVTTVHGTEDRIFPSEKADYLIEGGGHLMVINKSDQISKIIKEIVDSK